ncbi:MOSC domain-containing protein [Geodermatophilus sp. DSM 44513]|uniref:MOSC domain-containing protein n=1 Tax=Geodermatophilus sp. DSM 44513 TaxID=1528104 RepID=UPI00126AB926|nr:MOSC N-terminal beta barrel domain-containing protein [Geodermatophilus sp. DSM 44513]WNV75713.1 MOSC N-terminal beta barrel domain-containing protein [Geodermatophilus sp. DSM 44513]
MQVTELWRYPVKSLQGERLSTSEVGADGLAGDRQWALFDAATGLGLTARRVPDLLFLTGRLHADGGVEVVLPDGSVTAEDAVLSACLGRPVTLRAAADAPGERHYENPFGVGEAGEYDWDTFTGARGAFHDSSRTRVSLVSTGTLGNWDRRRFRANVVLDGEGEDALVGQRVRLGDSELDVVAQVPRCVMVTRPQPGGIGRDTGVLTTVHRQRDGYLAVAALVTRPGAVAVGDELAGW